MTKWGGFLPHRIPPFLCCFLSIKIQWYNVHEKSPSMLTHKGG
nr:MAG TPA: hypothetical protein [Caudoviricetes sp.]